MPYLEACDPLSSRQFMLSVRRLADSLNYGVDRSPFLGSGLDYAQSRPYEPGDSVKAIDWRITARTGRVFVKEYESPKRMPFWIVVDTSASMMASSQRLSKYAWAVQIAGGVAFAALDRASPVGLLGAGGRTLRFNPSLSRATVMQWLHELRHFRTDEPTLLSERLAELNASLTQRAILIVLSDFHSPEALGAMKLAAGRHEVVALQLTDPAERGWTGAGYVRAREAETGREFFSRGTGLGVVSPEEVGRQLRRVRADHLAIATDGPVAATLRVFFASRALFGRVAKG